MATNPYMYAGGGGSWNENQGGEPLIYSGSIAPWEETPANKVVQPGSQQVADPKVRPQVSAPTVRQSISNGTPSAMRNDWNSYFNSAKPGESINWGGGTLTMGADGSAKYAAQNAVNGGTVLNRASIDNPNTLQSLMASSPGIAQQWSSQYGVSSGLSGNDQAYWDSQLSRQSPQHNLGMGNGQGGGNGYGQGGGANGFQQPSQQSSTLSQNPWIQQQGNALQAQSNQNLQQNVLPGIGQGAQAAGMYGSSRQGIAQGQAIGNAQTGLNSALANMYSDAYRADQGYDLGLRSNDLGYANLDANIANSNFGNQMSAANFGLNAFNSQQAANNQAIQAGTQIQNTPYDYWNSFNTAANNVGNGLSSTTQSQTATGNPWLGALGGWQLGSKIGG